MNNNIDALMSMFNKVEATGEEADAMYEALAKKCAVSDADIESLNKRLAEADAAFEAEEKKRTPPLEWYNRPFSSL